MGWQSSFFAPAYLSKIVPLLGVAYGQFSMSFVGALLQAWVGIWLITGMLLLIHRRELPALSAAAGIAAAGFVVGYLLQHKGWSYHALPATGAALVALAALLASDASRRAGSLNRAVIAGAIVLCLVPSLRAGPNRSPYQAIVAPLLADATSGSPVIMLTAHPTRIFKMTEEAGLVWPSRYFGFWMVYAVAEAKGGPLSPEVAAMADEVRANTVEDLLCNPPEIIIVDDFGNSRAPGFDILAFFRKNDAFARLFAAYAETRKSGDFTEYRRQSELPLRPSGECRTVY